MYLKIYVESFCVIDMSLLSMLIEFGLWNGLKSAFNFLLHIKKANCFVIYVDANIETIEALQQNTLHITTGLWWN